MPRTAGRRAPNRAGRREEPLPPLMSVRANTKDRMAMSFMRMRRRARRALEGTATVSPVTARRVRASVAVAVLLSESWVEVEAAADVLLRVVPGAS